MIELEDRLYSTSEVANIIGVSLRSIYRYIEAGKLIPETQTLSGRHRFTKTAILEFLYPRGRAPRRGGTTKPTRTERPQAVFLATKVSPQPSGKTETPKRTPRSVEERPPERRLRVEKPPEEKPVQSPESPRPTARSSRETSKPSFHYFYSPIGSLKEIARTIDQSSRQAGLPYAFTLFGGLSLHYEIKPFSIIHVYVRKQDFGFFLRRLKLKPVAKEKANLCLLTADSSVFEGTKRLRNLTVVSDHRLLQDLLGYSEATKALAREFARKGGESNAR